MLKSDIFPGFKVWLGKINFREADFCFYYMFKINFLGTAKFGRHFSRMASRGYGPGYRW